MLPRPGTRVRGLVPDTPWSGCLLPEPLVASEYFLRRAISHSLLTALPGLRLTCYDSSDSNGSFSSTEWFVVTTLSACLRCWPVSLINNIQSRGVWEGKSECYRWCCRHSIAANTHYTLMERNLSQSAGSTVSFTPHNRFSTRGSAFEALFQPPVRLLCLMKRLCNTILATGYVSFTPDLCCFPGRQLQQCFRRYAARRRLKTKPGTFSTFLRPPFTAFVHYR